MRHQKKITRKCREIRCLAEQKNLDVRSVVVGFVIDGKRNAEKRHPYMGIRYDRISMLASALPSLVTSVQQLQGQIGDFQQKLPRTRPLLLVNFPARYYSTSSYTAVNISLLFRKIQYYRSSFFLFLFFLTKEY